MYVDEKDSYIYVDLQIRIDSADWKKNVLLIQTNANDNSYNNVSLISCSYDYITIDLQWLYQVLIYSNCSINLK
jgi:hypothetical protein